MTNTTTLTDILASDNRPSVRATLSVIASLSLPAIIEQIMITMVQYIDTAMVGSLGSTATAAVGVTTSCSWLIGGLLNAAAIGFSVQVAQRVGARDLSGAKAVAGQAVAFIALFGVLMAAIALAISRSLPRWLGADETVCPLASDYFRIMACAVPFNFCAIMLGGIIRCSGDTKTPMILNLSINAINVALNFLLIYDTRVISIAGTSFSMWGAGMGVSGAALASLMSLAIVSALYCIILYRKPSPVRLTRGASYRFTKPVFKTLWRLGLPVALERVMICVAQIAVTAIICRIGTVAIAANHLAVTAESLSYMPAYGVAAAATTMIGQAIGAGRLDMAKRFSRMITYIGIAIMTVGGIMLFTLAPKLIMLFTAEQPVIDLGAKVLRIVAFAEPFFAMAIVINGVLRGAGDTKAPFVISLITMWGVRVVMALLLADSMGLVGVWLAMSAELLLRGVLFMARMYRGRWLNIRIL